MIKFFRGLRQKLLIENKISKYFKYAIGEILLVVIGILIALQINNWNEESKNRVKEREALQGIKIALETDLELIKVIYEPRLDRKKQGLTFLKNAALNKTNFSVNSESLLRNIEHMETDIFFSNDTGSYDALKSAGFELIKNKELRSEIIYIYEVTLPSYRRFMNVYRDQKVALVQEYQKEVYSNYVVSKEDGTIDVLYKIKAQNVVSTQVFLALLAVEQDKYDNYINRMKSVKKFMNELIVEVDKELDND